MDVFLWGVLPYLVALSLIAGLVWRYRYDQFGWTTRSSQLYESRLLRIGSVFPIVQRAAGRGRLSPHSHMRLARPCIRAVLPFRSSG